MYFLLSGEGKTDLGQAISAALICEGDAFLPGPMTVIVDQITAKKHGYSFLDTARCGYVSEHRLTEHGKALKAVKKQLRLPGKKHARETRYFFNNARTLSRIARKHERDRKDEVVAVLFRDSDTASGGRGNWPEKRQSMLDGFNAEGFSRGVPMLPKPTSEAWILCGLKNAYHNCGQLENRTGSMKSPNPLKKELGKILGEVDIRDTLCEMLAKHDIDIERIEMNSFSQFRQRLEEVIV